MSDDNQSDLDDSNIWSDKYFGSSLHKAAANNDVQQLIKLISLAQSQGNSIDLNERDAFGKRPLHLAVANNVDSSHYKVTEVLLKHGADPNAKDSGGSTPLEYLAHNCNLDFLKLFLRSKADFTHLNVCRWSLLAEASTNLNNLDVLRFLVEDIGLDINHKYNFGFTPLHYAACSRVKDRHYEMLKYLLENGADVNARDNHGFTPLFYLVEGGGNWKVVELFLNYKADVHAVTDDGSSILFGFNSDVCDLQVLDKLIYDFGLDVNHLNIDNQTPLHNVLNSYNERLPIKLIKYFLKNGVNIEFPDQHGVMSIIKTVQKMNRPSEELCLKHINFFNFLIDQIDFKVVQNNTHILNFYKPHQSNYLWKWILEHLAKLKFLNLLIHPLVLEFIQDHINSKNYFEKCTKELEAMSKIKPRNCWINFFNLLEDSRRKLKNYAGNEDLINDYKNNDWLKMLPIYGAAIKKNVEKGLRRRKLFDKSSISLSDCLPIFGPKHLIVNNILDCMMSKKDLSKFCE